MSTDPRSGTRFAVYLCPPADSPYYHLGSGWVGYDVRAGRELPLPPEVQPEWQTAAGPYGFHLTLVEGSSCRPEALPEIEAELRACVACLSPAADLSLHGGRVELWDQGTVLAHVFRPSPDLRMLHAFLLARMTRFVTSSPFDDEIRQHPERYDTPWGRARMQLLSTPRGLDSFQPHYTLIDPFGGPPAEAERLQARLNSLLAEYHEQTYRSVALFVKPLGEERWQVQADVDLAVARSAAT